MAKDPCNSCVPSTAECESLPSALDNFIDSFYGQLEKQVVDGKVVWIPPCDLNEGLPGYPRADGEGLACYFLRLMGEIGVSALTVASIESAADYVQPLPNETVAVVVTNPQLLAVGCYVWSPDGGWYRVESIAGTSVVLRVLFEPPHSAEVGTEIDAPSKFLPVGPLTAWDEAIESAQTESEAFAASAAASAENSAKAFATSSDSVLSNNLQTFANSAANAALASANAYTNAKDSATRDYVDDRDVATLEAAEAYADSVIGAGFVAGRGIVKVGTTAHFAQSGPFPVGALPFASGSSTVGFSGLFWSSSDEQINFLQNSSGRPSGLILSNGFDAGRVSIHQVSQDAQHLAFGATFDGTDYVAAGTNAAILRRASDVFEFAFDDGLTDAATFTPTVRMRFDADAGLFEFLEAVDFNGVVGIQDGADNTKRLEFDIATVATGQTRVLTMGNRNVSLVPGATFAEAGAIGSSFLTMSTARLLGRGTAATGAIEEIQIGTGLDLTGGVLSTTAQPIFDADGNLVFTGGVAADELENGVIFVTSTPETGTVPAGEGYLWFDGTDLVLRVGTTNTVLGSGDGSVFDGNGNFLIGGATAPATMADGFAWESGVAPTADVADQVSLWVGDRTAGQAGLRLRSENGTLHHFGDRVGIGTLTPGTFFHVNGAAQFGGNVLIGTATVPTSLAGGVAIVNGTAPSANLTDGVSVWAADQVAGQSNLHVRGESGGITKIGSILHIDSPHAGNGQQVIARSGGTGAAAIGSFGGGNQGFSFGAYYNGSAWTADSNRALLQEVGSGCAWYFNTGLTAGNPVGTWSAAYTFISVSGGSRFIRFGVGAGLSDFGTGADNVVSIRNGTAPGTSPPDVVQLWSGDRIAGQAGLRIRSESGVLHHIGDYVGIGTDTPSRLFHTASSNPTWIIENTSSGVDQKMRWVGVSSGSMVFGKFTDGAGAATQQMHLDTNGNIQLINSSTPSAVGDLTNGIFLPTGTAASGTVAAGGIAIWFDGTNLRARIGTTDYTFTKT